LALKETENRDLTDICNEMLAECEALRRVPPTK
jgi:hypothetical protein